MAERATAQPQPTEAHEHPILFSAPMVLAILAGKKTQTRRILKQNRWGTVPLIGQGTAIRLGDGGLEWTPAGAGPVERWPADRIGEVCPYGDQGDRLWVKETFGYRGRLIRNLSPKQDVWVRYRADDAERTIQFDQEPTSLPEPKKGFVGTREEYQEFLTKFWASWRPSIFMPRWASRIDLQIMNVWVERLQEITVDDAMAEGIADPIGDEAYGWDPRNAFRDLWEKINGKRASWASNPWVWVVSFRRIRP